MGWLVGRTCPGEIHPKGPPALPPQAPPTSALSLPFSLLLPLVALFLLPSSIVQWLFCLGQQLLIMTRIRGRWRGGTSSWKL